MAKGVSARLKASADRRRIDQRSNQRAQGRKFGLAVGTAFLVLAAVAYWRGAHRTETVLGALGGILLLGGLVVPGSLGPVERAWMAMGHVISRITTPIVMGVLYFGLFTVVGGFKRIVGRNTLVRRRTAEGSFWVDRPDSNRRGDLHRQF